MLFVDVNLRMMLAFLKKLVLLVVLGSYGVYYCFFSNLPEKRAYQDADVTQKEKPVFYDSMMPQKIVDIKLDIRPDLKQPVWDLKDSELNLEEIAPFFKDGEPMAISVKREGRSDVFWNPNILGTGNGIGKVLNLSDSSTIQAVIDDRKNIIDKNLNQQHQWNLAEEQLGSRAYEVISFNPGWRDDGINRIKVPKNLANSIKGPDYNFGGTDLEDLRARVVSFGHRGEMVIRVKDNGWILNKEGPEFVIFENPMRIGNSQLIYQEFAKVGVSEEDKPELYQWFKCEPPKEISGCAGVVPTDEGGDRFDLSALGIEKIRFIKLVDTGRNKNYQGAPTEGFDLDALYLFHAFKI